MFTHSPMVDTYHGADTANSNADQIERQLLFEEIAGIINQELGNTLTPQQSFEAARHLIGFYQELMSCDMPQ